MKAQVRRPISPAMTQLQQHVALARHADPVVRNRGPEGIAAHALQVRTGARGHDNSGIATNVS